MNQTYFLSCDSTADLCREHFLQRDIMYVCAHFSLDGVEYSDDLGQSMSFDDFYAAMANGAMTATSQISIGEYEAHFTALLEQGKDVLHVCLSSGLSGSYHSAVNAAKMVREQFPDRKLFVVDSLGASSGFGLLMDQLADLRDGGMAVDELAQWAEDNCLRMHHWFFTTDLTYFVRGGRVSKAAGFFGGMLNICPLLNMDEVGHLIPREKIRSKKRVIQTIVDRMEQCADNGLDYDGKCYISMSACMEDAEAVAKLIEARFPKLNGRVLINSIGTTIGGHTGPGTVALFFWGKSRKNA